MLNRYTPTIMEFSRKTKLTELDFSQQINEKYITYILLNAGYLTGSIIRDKKTKK